jgi:hypothetical protein
MRAQTSSVERDARSSLAGVRYRPGRGGHVESYFLKVNDPSGRRALWLKATIYASLRARSDTSGPSPAIAEAWAVAFDRDRGHVAVKASVPYEKARFSERVVDMEVAGLALRAQETRGEIVSGGRSVAWDLGLTSDGIPLVHYPYARMYEGRFPSSKIVSLFPDLRARGAVTVNGERWEIDRWPGLLGHNWGPRHTPLYAWGHCNVWERDGASAANGVSAARSTPEGAKSDSSELPEIVFEGTSGRVYAGPVLLPLTTLLCLRFRGVRYDLNAPIDLLRNHAEVTPRRWEFAGENRHVAVRGEMWAETDDFVGLFYENPSGPPTHCLNSKLANARLEIEIRGRAPNTFRSRAAALEIGTTDPTHGVRMYA